MPDQPTRRTSRAEGSSGGHVQARARQRSPKPRPRLPWGPHPAALTRVPPSPTNSVGEGVHTKAESWVGRSGARAGAPHPQPIPRKLRGGREPVECAKPAEAHFRSPPPLRSGGRGPGGGGFQGMHRQPVEPHSTFSPLPAQFTGGGAGEGPPWARIRSPRSAQTSWRAIRASPCLPRAAGEQGRQRALVEPPPAGHHPGDRLGVPDVVKRVRRKQ